MSGININLSPPEAVAQFREIVRFALERERVLSPDLRRSLEQKAEEMRVHPVDRDSVFREVMAHAESARREAVVISPQPSPQPQPFSPAAPPLQPPPVAPPPQPQSRPVSPVVPSPQPQPSSPAAPPPQPPPVATSPRQHILPITIAILSVGMSWLSSIFFPSPEKEIKMYLILTMFLLSFNGSISYILTGSPVVALVTQVLYVMYQTFFVDEYISLFGIIQSIIFFMVFSWFKHRDVLFGVIMGNICIGMGIVFLAFAAQNFRIPDVEVALEWLAVSSCYAFGALIAIVLGKMFGKC